MGRQKEQLGPGRNRQQHQDIKHKLPDSHWKTRSGQQARLELFLQGLEEVTLRVCVCVCVFLTSITEVYASISWLSDEVS